MRKRRSNKGALIAVIASLSTVSVVSVGFASWLITGGATETVDGQISIEEVADSRFHIYNNNTATSNGISKPTVTYGSGNAIVFGPTASDLNATGDWLISKDSENLEQLSATVTFWVANLSTKAKGTDYDLDATIATKDTTSAANIAFNTAADSSHKYVAFPTITKNTSFTVGTAAADVKSWAKNDSAVAGDGLTYSKVTLALTFSWGDYFKVSGTNVNPYSFYNDGVKTAASHGDEALQVLEAIYAANGANFTVTLTTSLHQ